MMKEFALFTVSSSVLIYFLSPVSEEPKAVPEKVEQEDKRAPSQPKSVDDSWGYDDEDEYEDEEFVFGEPMVSDDDDEYDEDNDQINDELSEIAETTNSSATQVQAAQNQTPSRSHPSSPRGNQRGSKENPIVFKTNNPKDPAED